MLAAGFAVAVAAHLAHAAHTAMLAAVLVARAAGYEALYGYVLAENHEMLDLAARLGFTETSRDASEVTVVRRL